ncbi:hypothetical protein AB7M15_007232 [Bradyrhizobium ottawaense]|jgi:hypothetical protein
MSVQFWIGLGVGFIGGGSFGAVTMAVFVAGKDSDFPPPKGEHHEPRERNHEVGDRVAKLPR